MIESLKSSLIDVNDQFFIIKNKMVVNSFDHSKTVPVFEKGPYKIIHFVNEPINYTYHFANNAQVDLQEVIIFENNVSMQTNIHIGEAADVHYLSFMNSNVNSQVQAQVKIEQEESSVLRLSRLFIGQNRFSFNQEAILTKEKTQFHHKNVMVNSSGHEQDFHFTVTHKQAKSFSSLQNYGICNHNSLLTIFTDGIIEKNANASELKQKVKGLILDEKSQISANPWLEINEHDCIASHGASIGAIDDQELYYLMSRGLTKELSEKLIINGFIWPLISEVPAGKLRIHLLQWLDTHL
ncbi:MAG: SufD family Fe-S cluster assembly protein [Bacilli bacterium]